MTQAEHLEARGLLSLMMMAGQRRLAVVAFLGGSLVALLAPHATLAGARQEPAPTAQSTTAEDSAPPQEPAAAAFSVRSELVVMHVTVKDRKGAYVTGLPATAFTIFEDDKQQPIQFFAPEDAPVTVGLVVDSSGSMQPSRDLVVTAAGAFASSSNPEDELFGLTFNERVRIALPPSSPFTSDATVLERALDRAISARGLTALYDGILSGLDYANRGSHLRKAIVVVSDGADNASGGTFERVLRRTQVANAVIYTIALLDPAGDSQNPALLRRIALGSGGEAFNPKRTADVVDVMRHIARDIRNTYTLGYVPADGTADGTFHRIRVTVTAPGRRDLIVRTRQGYVLEASSDGR